MLYLISSKVTAAQEEFNVLILERYHFLKMYSLACNGITLKNHRHLPPWIRSFELFWHRRIAIVSWGVHGLFFLEVCS